MMGRTGNLEGASEGLRLLEEGLVRFQMELQYFLSTSAGSAAAELRAEPLALGS
jgi:hypothetical protein